MHVKGFTKLDPLVAEEQIAAPSRRWQTRNVPAYLRSLGYHER